MNVYPYEVPLVYMDSNNNNGIGASSILYRKEVIKKIPGKGGCKEMQMKTNKVLARDNNIMIYQKMDDYHMVIDRSNKKRKEKDS